MLKVSYSVVIIMALCAMMAMACHVNAQGKLTEQTFSNPNIFASALGKMDSEITNQRAKAISNAEKKKGRKLTSEEMAKVDKAIAEARKKAAALKDGISMGITVTFLSDTELKMHNDIRVNDEALKATGMGWLKRKALKASLSVMPKTMKEKYLRKGQLIIISPDDDPDTLRLSTDGRQLTGRFDKTTVFTLDRQ